MKKIFYILLGLSLFSCSTDDDVINETPSEDLQPDKAYVFLMDYPNSMAIYDRYYKLTYENGRLKNIMGKFYPFSSPISYFNPNVLTQFTYSNNKVLVNYFEAPQETVGYKSVSYTLENGRPAKAEHYYNYNNNAYPAELEFTNIYTYSENTIKVYMKSGAWEYFTTYYFDAKNNLTKKEFLERAGNIDHKITTTTYSDFDNAKNAFKKFYLVNDELFEKSLSANNFRGKETVSQYFPTEANGGIVGTPGYSNSHWTYNYDSNGQVLLYFPLQ
ncbi:hypothetical protein [Chryseobacterium sp. JK1]|uniref:hypothetical protein n=1 Tax=Chryseobacterium sp. JK1 TaxID=874294 RepID=UPI003D68A576